jgi:serine/threonine protein phosphatase PrpC
MKYQIADYSVRGGRPVNQDRVGYAERDNALLVVLADGLGGHDNGELASELLVQRTIHMFQSIRKPLIQQPSAFLALSILQAHAAINAMGRAHDPPIKPRTTCVLLLVQDGYAYWAHVGDSRLYLFRNGKLHTRTMDHTITERMRQEGILTEEEMLSHPEKSRLLQCVGGPTEPSIRIGPETALLPGDTLLLCSDGLWESTPADALQRYIARDDLEDAVVDMLVTAEAQMGKSADNITAACMRWQDEPTRKKPLEEFRGGEVDHKSLWSQAQRKAAIPAPRTAAPESRAKPRPVAAPATPKTGATTSASEPDTLNREIEELESFLDQYLPKR